MRRANKRVIAAILTLVLTCGFLFPAGAAGFSPRLSAPDFNTYASGNPYPSTSSTDSNGNCTWYAWGRAREILGYGPSLSRGNAGTWYNYSDGFARGQTPKLGAIICWGGTPGHVAVVEEISGNAIHITEASYLKSYWHDRWLTIGSYGAGFQGFIYLGDYTATPVSTVPSKPTIVPSKTIYQPGESISLSWNASTNAAWYDLYIEEVGGSGRSRYYDSSEIGKRTNVSFDNFPSGNWRARVIACNSLNGGQYTSSDFTSFTVQANSYTILYNANGGSGAPSSQTKIHGTALTLRTAIPTRTGYDFLGWSASSTASMPTYIAGGSYTADANATLYAVWYFQTYTVAYNANGGSGAPSSQTKYKDTALTLSSVKPSRTGYEFLGWSTVSNAATPLYYASGSYTANAHATLYAVWAPVYMITYDVGLAGAINVPATQTKPHNSSVYLSSLTPMKEHYYFLGWYTTNGTKYNPGDTYSKNENLQLKARWATYGQVVQDGTYTYEITETEAILYRMDSSASSITLPNQLGGKNLTMICTQAFTSYNCPNLTSITLPKDFIGFQYLYVRYCMLTGTQAPFMYSLPYNPFATCDKLLNIYVNAQNPFYASVDGVLFNKDKTELLLYPWARTATSYAIPDGVTTIGRESFSCSSLSSLTVPDTLAHIGMGAFASCTNLKQFSLPNTITSIGNRVFFKCDLSSIDLSNIVDIGEYALFGNKALPAIDLSNVSIIGDAAFSDCSSLATVDIPASAASIGTAVFSSCNSLTAINVAEDNPLYASIDGVLFDKEQTTLMQYPAAKSGSKYVIPPTVVNIGTSAFSGSVNLMSVTIPEGVTRLNSVTFSRCEKLTHIAMPASLINLGTNTFLQCTNLRTFTLPDGVDSNNSQHFSACANLESIVVLDQTTNARQLAFTYGYNSDGTAVEGNPVVYCYENSAAHQSAVRYSIPYILLTAANTYAVTYNANGGNNAPASQLKVRDIGMWLQDYEPTRTGYTFQGWATSSTATTPQYQPDDYYTANAGLSLFAVWQPNSYTVVYDPAGGADAPASQTKIKGEPLVLSSDAPMRDGYTFQGWATSENVASAAYQPGVIYTSDASVTLYAVWRANTYSVKYNSNGGDGTMANSMHTYGTARNLAENVFTKPDFFFAGWSTSSGGTAIYEDQENIANLTFSDGAIVELYAAWEQATPTTYAVAVNGNDDIFYIAGATVTITADPAPSGQRFKEWDISPAVSFTDGTSKTSVTAKFTMPAGAVTALAVYEGITPTTYLLTVNGGTGGGHYEAGVTVSIAANPAPSGKAFDKWTATAGMLADATNASTTFIMLAGAATVTATYKDTPPAPADKTALNSRINELGSIQKGNYTDESWNAFQSALTNAQAVAGNASATQEQVNNALSALNAAYAGLREKTTPPSPIKYIFSTKHEATPLNWILFFVCFGWLWMWF